jgi:hypothetical protein
MLDTARGILFARLELRANPKAFRLVEEEGKLWAIIVHMQYFHQAKYGHAGGMHTARPLYVLKNDKHVYTTAYHPMGESDKPLYAMRGNHLYSTIHHPEGVQPHAQFEIRGDKVHTTLAHPQHNASSHVFELRPHL